MDNVMQQDFTPEQMETFKKGFQVGQKLIYQKNVFDTFMGEIEQDPTGTMAKVIVKILSMIQEKAGKLDMIVATALGISLLGDIADAINQTGRHELTADDITDAFGKATQFWLTKHGKQYSRDELMSAKDQITEGAQRFSQEQGQQEEQPGGILDGAAV